MKTLVLGYGNRSRNDDGVGWFVVERLEKAGLSDVEFLTSHQLDVDHAELLTHFDSAIFVDATLPQSPTPISLTVVQPIFRSHAVAHYLTPSDLLALAQELYGHVPHALLFAIRGHDFNFGTTLSIETARAACDAVRQIQELLTTLPPAEMTGRDCRAHA